MIDIMALKFTARQSMSGKKPSVFLVAAAYLVIFTLLTGLISALFGYDKILIGVERILLINPVPSYGELAAVIPPLAPVAGLLILALMTVKLIIDVGYMGYCLKICRNEETDTKTIFDSFALFLKILWLKIFQTLLIVLWSVFFILPGIVAYYKYRQSFYILLDNPEAGTLQCLRQSARLMDGYKTALFFLDLSFVGWRVVDLAIRGIAALRLFSIWLFPYIGVARAGFYNLLVEARGTVGEPG